MPDRDGSYANLADKHLGAPSDRADSKYDMTETEYAQIEALRGIGYALLAIREDAARQSGELADMVHSVADQVGDLAVPADRLADAADRPRWWQVRRRRRRLQAVGNALNDARRTLFEAPSGMVPPEIDEDAYERAFRGWRDRSAVVLPAADVVTVRRALADAAAHRTPPGDRSRDWYLGIEEDERLSAGYAALLARLGGSS